MTTGGPPVSLAFPRETYDYPDPTTQTQKNAFRTKGASKFYDPCATSSAKSMKCLEQNNYDKSKCYAAFTAYRECKRTWMNKKKEDRKNDLPEEKRFW